MTVYRSIAAATLAAALIVGVQHARSQPAPTTPPAQPVPAAPAPYDIVIRNGRILDGEGNPWVRADVAISQGRFVKIGRIEGRGSREIDAHGDFVSPGWIDMMDQSGEVLLKNGLAEKRVPSLHKHG